MMNAEEVFRQALALPTKDRASLANKLLDSLDDVEEDPFDDDELATAWAAEIELRRERANRGEEKVFSAEEVTQEAQQLLARRKQ